MKKEIMEQSIASIEFFLSPQLFTRDIINRISQHLIAGDLIVIRNAFEKSLARRMFRCLDQFGEWKLYEGFEEHFHYRHHNIYDETLFPLDLVFCRDIFSSVPTRRFVQRLSRIDCTGTTFGASWYQPGDHSLPHNDYVGSEDNHRQVAFVWMLTKEWQPEWGGEFFWCQKGRGISPEFNTLLLFRVQLASVHFVTQVSRHAQGKRLALSGWWTRKKESQPDQGRPEHGKSAPPVLEII